MQATGQTTTTSTKSATDAAAVFQRLGLNAPGLLEGFAVPSRDAANGSGKSLKVAFQELGGVYLAFAEFLRFRADLLGMNHLRALQELESNFASVPRTRVAEILRRELGESGERLAAAMEEEPAWSTLLRTAYRSRFGGECVVVQVAREPFSEAEVLEFDAGIRYLGAPTVARAVEPQTLAEFRRWLRQAEACATERSYLEVLGRAKSQTLAAYPELIPELCTNSVLCWPWVEGESVREGIAAGSADAVTKAAMAVLEQYCTLSMVDADPDPDAMVISYREKRLTFRRFNRPMAVPDTAVNGGMKYIAAVLEGHLTVTAQTLVKLAVGKSTSALESGLLGFMSAIEPELKVGLWFPPAAAAFEINWKSLAELGTERPLYLNCLHRNLIATGYWTAEAVAAGAPQTDTITEAHWPVVQQLLKLSTSRLADRTVAMEWTVGLGLLAFGAVREANRLAEEVRDNNLTLEVDTGAGKKTAAPAPGSGLLNDVLIGVLLVLLLATFRWGATVSPGAQWMVVAVASVALLLLFVAVAKKR